MANNLRRFLPFLIVAGASVVISAAGSVAVKTYFGTKVAAEDSVEPNMAKYGNRITTKEFLGSDYESIAWLKSGFYSVETYTRNKNEDTKDDQLVEYNENNGLFTFTGVGNGYAKFTSKIDTSVSYTKYFESTFRSDSTKKIITESISGLSLDGIFKKDDIARVSTIRLKNTEKYDFRDIKYLPNIDSVLINHSTKTLARIDNFELSENIYVYVGNMYDDYMARTEVEWVAAKNQIFIDQPSQSQVNLLIYKNKGKFTKNDNPNKDVQSFLVDKNKASDLLSNTSITREGYNFSKFTDVRSAAVVLDNETILETNVKVNANYGAKNYSVHFHIPDEAEEETVVNKIFTYDKKETLYGIDDVPALENRTFVGWTTKLTDNVINYQPGEQVTNINGGNETDLYAVYRWNSYTLTFTDDEGLNVGINNVDKDYQQTDSLLSQFENKDKGILLGWNYSDLESKTAEYSNKDPYIPFINLYSYSYDDINPGVVMHAVYSADATCNVYFIGLNDRVMNYFLEGIARETSFNINSIEKIVGLQEWEEKLGYKLVGWKDIQVKDKENVYKYVNNTDDLTIDQIAFGSEAYYYEAVFESNTISFSYTDTDSKTNVISTQYDDENGLSFDDTYSDCPRYKHKGFTYEYFTIGDSQEAKRGDIHTSVNTVSKLILILSQDIQNLYATIINENDNIKNQYFNLFNNNDRAIELVEQRDCIVNHITYSAGSGSFSDKTTTKVEDAYYNEPFPKAPETPTKPGFQFTGWACSDGNQTYDELSKTSVYKLERDFTFTAQFKDTCVTGDTKIELINGETVNIRDVEVGDIVKTYDFFTGEVCYLPVVFSEKNEIKMDNILRLRFADETIIRVRSGHCFFDATLMQYVTINEGNYLNFVGHKFAKINDDDQIETYELISAELIIEYIDTCEIVTVNGAITFIANGYLSSANYTEDVINLFNVDSDFKYDEEAMQNDIETFGLFEYADLAIYGIPEEIFNMFNGQYLKVPVSKGTLTIECILFLLESFIYEN